MACLLHATCIALLWCVLSTAGASELCASASSASGVRTEEGYDAVGNEVTITDGNRHTTAFEYDGLNGAEVGGRHGSGIISWSAREAGVNAGSSPAGAIGRFSTEDRANCVTARRGGEQAWSRTCRSQ
jgi:hypothetical protein